MSKEILDNVISPALNSLSAHGVPVTGKAKAMLCAIGLQESRLTHRYQIIAGGNPGPARGLWQFEAGGGVHGVMNHKASSVAAAKFATEFVGSHNQYAIWASLRYEDILAAIFARLLLWTDAKALPEPTIANEKIAWDYYIRNWRPGKPHPETWTGFWKQAVELAA